MALQMQIAAARAAFHTHKLDVDSGPFLVLGRRALFIVVDVFCGGGPWAAEVEFHLAGEEWPQIAAW